MINIPLLRKTLEYITAHPDEWEQGVWGKRVWQGNVCRTSHCLAGHAVVLNGDELSWTLNRYNGVRFACLNDAPMSIRDRAQELLGLTYYQAGQLFESANSLRKLWTLAGEFTNGEIEAPEIIP